MMVNDIAPSSGQLEYVYQLNSVCNRRLRTFYDKDTGVKPVQGHAAIVGLIKQLSAEGDDSFHTALWRQTEGEA